MIKRFLSWWKGGKNPTLPPNYKSLLDPDAVQVVETLRRAGYETYLVGGCVRDVLLRKKPKDFDIATKASPQQVRALVRRCFIIGKRFRIVLAKRPWRETDLGGEKDHLLPFATHHLPEKELQITTFRREPTRVNEVINENVFGTAEEDALRRDFTLNALFLEPKEGRIVDFCGGMEDLQNRVLRVIGDPAERFREDPVRILRALRFLAKAGLHMEPRTEKALKSSIDLLANAKKERLREELLKILKEGSAERVFRDLEEMHAWKHFSPDLAEVLKAQPSFKTWLAGIAHEFKERPWTHPKEAAPLFLLFLYPLVNDTEFSQHKLDAIMNDLKVSRAEREHMDRILQTVSRMLRDSEGRQASRLLPLDPRHTLVSAASIYVLRALHHMKVSEASNVWHVWEKEWKSRIHEAHLDRGPPKHGGGGSNHSAPRSGSSRRRPRRGRRRRGPGSAPSSAAPASSGGTSGGSSST